MVSIQCQVDGKSRGILNDEELTILLCHSSIYHYPARHPCRPSYPDGGRSAQSQPDRPVAACRNGQPPAPV